MGTAQAVLPHPATALLSAHRQVTWLLHFWGCVLFFFAFFLCPIRIWNSLHSKSLPSSAAQVPPQMGTVASLEICGIAVQLLKEENQCKFSACSSTFMASKQQNTTLPQPALCILTPNAPPSPWTMRLTGSNMPRFGQCCLLHAEHPEHFHGHTNPVEASTKGKSDL